VLYVVPTLFLFLSLFILNREARLTRYQSQLSQIMFLWILLALTEVAVAGSLKPHRLITFIPPLSYFISHYILLIRKKKRAEFSMWIFIIAIASLMYLARYNKIKSVNYSNLFPAKSGYDQYSNKRILILGTDWGLFESNKMATGFYDWELTRSVFTDLTYFENVVIIDRAFGDDAPDIIIDKENIMKEVFRRIPQLQSVYHHEGYIYIRK